VKGKEYRARFPIMTSWPAGQTNKRQNKKKISKEKKKKRKMFLFIRPCCLGLEIYIVLQLVWSGL